MLSSQFRRPVSHENRIDRRLVICNDVSEWASGRSACSSVRDIGEVDIDRLRDGDAATNRSINLILKESDIFCGGEGSGKRIRAPCLGQYPRS